MTTTATSKELRAQLLELDNARSRLSSQIDAAVRQETAVHFTAWDEGAAANGFTVKVSGGIRREYTRAIGVDYEVLVTFQEGPPFGDLDTWKCFVEMKAKSSRGLDHDGTAQRVYLPPGGRTPEGRDTLWRLILAAAAVEIAKEVEGRASKLAAAQLARNVIQTWQLTLPAEPTQTVSNNPQGEPT